MNITEKHNPPRVAEALMGWLLQDVWQTPLGDYFEYYNELLDEKGTSYARWWYRAQVLRLLPDRLAIKTYWNLIMLKNYMVLAYRNLLKNKVSSAINIIGLSIAIACSIVVYLFLQGYLTMDTFHENGETIFLVEHTVKQDEDVETWGTSPMPLGPAMAASFPQIERAVRINTGGALVQSGETVFEEWIVYAEDGFFEMFTFPLAQGTPDALSDPNAVIISPEMAVKYFGETDPMDRELVFSFGNNRNETLTVRGVAEEFPGNKGFYFNFLLNFRKLQDQGFADLEDWASFADATFIQVRDPQDIETLAGQMHSYIAQQNAAHPDWQILSFQFDNLWHPAPDAFLVRDRFIEPAHPGFILMLLAIPFVMLVLSCFNYVNIALGASANRLREIGVRKTMGGTRRQLILQFISENLLLCFLSLLLGLGIAQAFLVPLFNSIFVNLVELTFFDSIGLWVFLVGLLVFVGVASGAYPAFYISSFQPVAIFQGRQNMARKKWFTRSFLTFQFILAFVTVITGIYISLNGTYILEQDWGYNAEQTLVIRITESDQYNLMVNEAAQLPSVIRMAGSYHHVGESMGGDVLVEVDGTKQLMRYYSVGSGYFETLGLRLTLGRFFEETSMVDAEGSIVINQAFVEARGWSEPIGKAVRIDSTMYLVAGVVENFLPHPMIREIPLFFRQSDSQNVQYLSIRMHPGTSIETARALEAAWERLIPSAPFNHFFQNEVFDIHYTSYSNLAQAFGYIAALALLISCMGLFGLASQNVARRQKEVSIRKVLGASVSQITYLVNRGFITMLVLAAVVASAVCYFGLSVLTSVVEVKAIHMPMRLSLFLVSYTLIFSTAALSVAMQARKLVRANPADVLRNE